MGIKDKLIMSVFVAVLGISLIAGGTSAYFTDVVSNNNTISTGSMKLGLNNEEIFHVEGLVPGDTEETPFKLTNEGSMDMEDITLNTSYKDNGENQNHFQTDQVKLNWEFEAVQLGNNSSAS